MAAMSPSSMLDDGRTYSNGRTVSLSPPVTSRSATGRNWEQLLKYESQHSVTWLEQAWYANQDAAPKVTPFSSIKSGSIRLPESLAAQTKCSIQIISGPTTPESVAAATQILLNNWDTASFVMSANSLQLIYSFNPTAFTQSNVEWCAENLKVYGACPFNSDLNLGATLAAICSGEEIAANYQCVPHRMFVCGRGLPEIREFSFSTTQHHLLHQQKQKIYHTQVPKSTTASAISEILPSAQQSSPASVSVPSSSPASVSAPSASSSSSLSSSTVSSPVSPVSSTRSSSSSPSSLSLPPLWLTNDAVGDGSEVSGILLMIPTRGASVDVTVANFRESKVQFPNQFKTIHLVARDCHFNFVYVPLGVQFQTYSTQSSQYFVMSYLVRRIHSVDIRFELLVDDTSRMLNIILRYLVDKANVFVLADQLSSSLVTELKRHVYLIKVFFDEKADPIKTVRPVDGKFSSSTAPIVLRHFLYHEKWSSLKLRKPGSRWGYLLNYNP